MSTQPPFRIGDKIVCVKSHSERLVVKDKIYVVKDISLCQCGYWSVDVGVTLNRIPTWLECPLCKCLELHHDMMWFGHQLFAPIQESYADATQEILKKFKETEEVPDRILIPETITS